jgi:hypothetical protein
MVPAIMEEALGERGEEERATIMGSAKAREWLDRGQGSSARRSARKIGAAAGPTCKRDREGIGEVAVGWA